MRIEDFIEYGLESSRVNMNGYLELLQDSLRELEECCRTGCFENKEVIMENCLYYETKYIEAVKEVEKYLNLAEDMGLDLNNLSPLFLACGHFLERR